MFYRPRVLAAFICLSLAGVVASACSLEVEYADSHYACANNECPSGYECRAGFCETIERSTVDAAAGTPDGFMALSVDAATPPADAAPPPPPPPPPPPDAAPPPPDAGLPCTGVLDPGTGHCYFRVKTPSLTWANAQASCMVLSAHLATVTSTTEQNLVASLNDGTVAEAWMGAHDEAVEGDWRWIDNVDFPPSPSPNASSFQRWGSGEPNNLNNEDCLLIKLTSSGNWDDRRCDQTLSSICERD